jgi:hypothetical protein
MVVIFYLVVAVAIACVLVPLVLGARRKNQASREDRGTSPRSGS